MASGVFGVVGTGYAVLLGFVIFSVFGSYDAARQTFAQESVAMRQLASTAAYFGPAAEQALRSQRICCGRAVLAEEWPAMQDSRESPVVTGWVARLDATTQALPVSTNREAAALQNWFRQTKDRQKGRRGRIAEAAPFVPGFVWALMVALLLVFSSTRASSPSPGGRCSPRRSGWGRWRSPCSPPRRWSGSSTARSTTAVR